MVKRLVEAMSGKRVLGFSGKDEIGDFFVVTDPGRMQMPELADILFKADVFDMILQKDGGLKGHEILGLFKSEKKAKNIAMKALELENKKKKLKEGTGKTYLSKEVIDALIKSGKWEVEYGDAKGKSGSSLTLKSWKGQRRNVIIEKSFVSDALKSELDELHDELEDWMMHTEMLTDEAGPDAKKHMLKSWSNMDKAYEAFMTRAKLFIRTAKLNEAVKASVTSFKDLFEKSAMDKVKKGDKNLSDEELLDAAGELEDKKWNPDNAAEVNKWVNFVNVQLKKRGFKGVSVKAKFESANLLNEMKINGMQELQLKKLFNAFTGFKTLDLKSWAVDVEWSKPVQTAKALKIIKIQKPFKGLGGFDDFEDSGQVFFTLNQKGLALAKAFMDRGKIPAKDVKF